jgi:hypothetical protein
MKTNILKFKKLSMIIFVSSFYFLAFVSCRQVHIYESRHDIINRLTDSSLNDSVLILGHVFSAVDNSPAQYARVWEDQLKYEASTDITGYYILKLPSGIYTLHCLRLYTSEEFTETIKDIVLLPNEKIEINFYIGEKIE